MRQIQNGAVALALIGVLAACSDDEPAADAAANEEKQTTSPAATPACPAVDGQHDALAPGCWAIQIHGLTGSPLAQLDLPRGFTGNEEWVWVNSADKENEWGAITLMPVGDVYPDPCRRAGDPPEVGPSVDDFATALAAQKVTTTTKPVPMSLDGHDGVYLELSVPADFDVSTCRDGAVGSWAVDGEAIGGVDPGQVQRDWIVDVDGQRVVLSVATTDDAPDDTVELFTGIAEKATFAG